MLKKYLVFDKKLLSKILLYVLISITLFFLLFSFKKVSFVDLLLTVLPQQEIPDSPYVLMAGIDATKAYQRSDALILFKIHNYSKKVNIISIPRDSYVYIPNKGYDKINHAYAYGGMGLLQLSIEELFKIDIDRYLKISLNDLRYFINILGGINLNVEKRMFYEDKAAKLKINLFPGKQRLNSEQAMGYIRYRNTSDGDIGRTRRQQKLIRAIFKEITTLHNIAKIPIIVAHLKRRLQTNLKLTEIIWFAAKIKKAYDCEQFFQATIPGKIINIKGISYWQIDQSAKDYILKKANDPKEFDYNNPLRKMLKEKTISIEILNGNGVPGSALRVAKKLRSLGIKVPSISNSANYNYNESVLAVWNKSDKYTKELKKYFGLKRRNVKIYNKKKRIYGTLVLGKDWQRFL